MAEGVGVALGVLALAGALKDCIDLFSTIAAMKSFGSDYEILNTKIDIERTLLAQWVDRVGFFRPEDYDRRLDDQRTIDAISKILASMQQLFKNSTNLQKRYGLQQHEPSEMIVPAFGNSRLERVTKDFNNLSLQINTRQKHSSVARKVCWVVQDKEKFLHLVSELSYFIGELNALLPGIHVRRSELLESDLNDVRRLHDVQLVLQAAQEQHTVLASLAQGSIEQRCTKRVLDCLWFRRIDERQRSISTAHVKTLSWALHPPNSDVAWDDLVGWLQSGSGLYWVNGKAGSGKSTLMKYLHNHPGTLAALEAWAGQQRLILASFFFWNLGTDEQKSQHGLYRALLYQILDAEPRLIPHLLPAMGREAHDASKDFIDVASLAEMAEAFTALESASPRHKFCFFIDGLDEFIGNFSVAVNFVESLARISDTKVIVSSRPETSFRKAFRLKPQLRLQDLTRNDIDVYINDIVGNHPHLRALRSVHSQDMIDDVLRELRDKASGGFSFGSY